MNSFMYDAYKESLKAFKKGEIPVGAVIVRNSKILATGRNDRQRKHNILGHAEINAIKKASKKIRDWRLNGCIMYVTLAPCEMCEKVIEESRIDQVYYLVDACDKKYYKQMYVKFNDKKLSSQYSALLSKFFKELR